MVADFFFFSPRIHERIKGMTQGLQIKQREKKKKGIAFSHPGNKPCVLRLTRITCVYVCDTENAFFNLEFLVQSNSVCCQGQMSELMAHSGYPHRLWAWKKAL